MMKNIIIGIVIALVVVVGYGFVTGSKTVVVNPVGSSIGNNPFNSLNISDGSLTNQLKTRFGTLGSVVITKAGAGEINIYNATTSNVNLRALATSSLQVLATFPDSVVAGTYNFNIVATDGILVVLEATKPVGTITYK